MKKQGKVKAVPIGTPRIGMQVIPKALLVRSSICKIREIVNEQQIKISDIKGNIMESLWMISDFEELVVQVELDSTSRLEYPLKYSQWQAAIDNGEVNSDKVVEFEISKQCKSSYCECSENECTSKLPIYAKIIPVKKQYSLLCVEPEAEMQEEKGKLLLIPVEDDQAIIDCTLWTTKDGKPFINTYDSFLSLLQEGYKPIKPVIVSLEDDKKIIVFPHQVDQINYRLIANGIVKPGDEVTVKWVFVQRGSNEVKAVIKVQQPKMYTEAEVKLLATRFAHECRLKGCITNKDTVELFDNWFENHQ